MSLSIMNSSQDPYANDRGMLQVQKNEFKGNVSIITYKNRNCLNPKVGELALAIFVLILTLGSILLIPKARTWVFRTFDEFREKTVVLCHEDKNTVQSNEASVLNVPQSLSQLSLPPQPMQVANQLDLRRIKDEMLVQFDDSVRDKLQKWWQYVIYLEDQVWLLELAIFQQHGICGPTLERMRVTLPIWHVPTKDILKAKVQIKKDFENMTAFSLSDIPAFCRIPSLLSACKNLKSLDLTINTNITRCSLDLSVFPKLEKISFNKSKFYRLPTFNENRSLKSVSFSNCQVEEVIVPDLKELQNLKTFRFADIPNCIDFDFSSNPRLQIVRMPNSQLTKLPKLPPPTRDGVFDFRGNMLDSDDKKKLEDLKPHMNEVLY